eukprot:7388154-Prymnesium_polylepis.1
MSETAVLVTARTITVRRYAANGASADASRASTSSAVATVWLPARCHPLQAASSSRRYTLGRAASSRAA